MGPACSKIDFEIDDAVAKLDHLDLVEGSIDGLSDARIDGRAPMVARPLPASLQLLDQRWDDLFQPQPAGSNAR
jgi:hypothetical protein